MDPLLIVVAALLVYITIHSFVAKQSMDQDSDSDSDWLAQVIITPYPQSKKI